MMLTSLLHKSTAFKQRGERGKALLKEIADLREVLGALQEAAGFDDGEVARMQEGRRAKRGRFERRLRLRSIAERGA